MSKVTTKGSAGLLARLRSLGWSRQLVVLGLLLAIVFAAGGSSRYDTPQVVVLRPLAICAAGFALLWLRAQHLQAYRPLLVLSGLVLLLTIAHLVPLPPGIWHLMPGRDIVVEIDAFTGSTDIWRPLSLFPEGTWNALYALSVPLAVLLLACQLSEQDLVRLLKWLLFLCLASGVVGVMQAAGSDLRFYRFTGGTGGLLANRNHQAVLLACVFPMLAAWVLTGSYGGSRQRATRLAAGAGAILLVPLILVTGSRMGLVIASLAFVFTGLVSLRQRSQTGGGGYAWLARVLGGLAAIAGLVMATVTVSRDVALDRLNDAGDEMRWPIWESVADFIPHYMPWGAGIGSFVPVYQIHESDDMLMPRYVNQAHNDWLDLVLTAGLPGIALAMVAAVMLMRAAKTTRVAPGIAGHLRRAGLGMILVLAFASLSDYPVRTPILSAVLAIAAIWVSVPLRRQQVTESNRPDAEY